MHIFVYDFLDTGLQFFTAVSVVAHAEASLLLTEKTASRLGTDGATRYGCACCVDDIEVEQPTERMFLFDVASHTFGIEQWMRCESISLETRLQVAFLHPRDAVGKGYTHCFRGSLCHHK